MLHCPQAGLTYKPHWFENGTLRKEGANLPHMRLRDTTHHLGHRMHNLYINSKNSSVLLLNEMISSNTA